MRNAPLPPFSPWGSVVCMEQCESAAALLESVREQEMQFEQLTRALEEERRRVGLPAASPSALGRPLPHPQVTPPNKPEHPRFSRLLSDLWIIVSPSSPRCLPLDSHPPVIHPFSASLLCSIVCIHVNALLLLQSPSVSQP